MSSVRKLNFGGGGTLPGGADPGDQVEPSSCGHKFDLATKRCIYCGIHFYHLPGVTPPESGMIFDPEKQGMVPVEREVTIDGIRIHGPEA